MEKEGGVSTSLVFHSKHLKFYSYSSDPSAFRFIENNVLDLCAVADLRVE